VFPNYFFVPYLTSSAQESLGNLNTLLELRDKYLAIPEDDRGAFLEEQVKSFKEGYEVINLLFTYALVHDGYLSAWRTLRILGKDTSRKMSASLES
jgi:hypothetical protein